MYLQAVVNEEKKIESFRETADCTEYGTTASANPVFGIPTSTKLGDCIINRHPAQASCSRVVSGFPGILDLLRGGKRSTVSVKYESESHTSSGVRKGGSGRALICDRSP